MVVLIIITLILTSIVAYYQEFIYEQLNTIKAGLLLAVAFFYLYQQSNNSEFHYLIFIAFAIVFYTIFDGFIDANQLIEQKNKFDYVLIFENKKIQTSENLLYLGKTSDFIYLHNKADKKSFIISSDKLTEISIVK